MKQDDPKIPASRDPDPDSGAWNRRMGVSLKWLMGVAAFATLIIGSMLRGVEPWMLPQSLWRTEQWIWLAMASAGGLGFTGFMISLGSGRNRLRLAILALAISVSIAGGMRWVGGEFALNRFFNSEELHGTVAIRPDSFSATPRQMAGRQKDRCSGMVEDPGLRLTERWRIRRGCIDWFHTAAGRSAGSSSSA